MGADTWWVYEGPAFRPLLVQSIPRLEKVFGPALGVKRPKGRAPAKSGYCK